MNTYTLQFKTGDSELRALKMLPSCFFESKKFRLIIEITRGRRSKKDAIGDLHKRINTISEFLSPNTTVFFDITSNKDLSSSQIDELYEINEGYQNWQNLFKELHLLYKNSIPMLLINDADEDYSEFVRQTRAFCDSYGCFGYKIDPSLNEDLLKREINLIRDNISNNTRLYLIYDQGYIVSGLEKMVLEKTLAQMGLISGILNGYPNVEYIFSSTSFPDSVTSLSEETEGYIHCSEITMYEKICKESLVPISYADYGSVTPKRNDDAAFYGRGWTPRIDFPVLNNKRINYFREQRLRREYTDVYTNVARKCIEHPEFPKELSCWGIDTIRNAAAGYKPGATPSFWISVRMNIFVTEQLKKLSIPE